MYMEDSYFEWIEPEPEPEAIHRISIYTVGQERHIAEHWTNDNLDHGYPSEEASWRNVHKSIVSALKCTGGSRQGIGCRVIVTLNGDEISDEKAKELIKKAKGEQKI